MHYDLVLKNSSSFKIVHESCSYLNILLMGPSALLNASLIAAVLLSKERERPCTVLLVNLAVTDLLTGTLSMPAFSIIFRRIFQGKMPCDTAVFILPVFVALNIDSFLTVTTIAVERYTSIFHPYFHAARVTKQVTLAFIGISWLVAILTSIPFLLVVKSVVVNGFIGVFVITGVFIIVYCYARIFWRARELRIQIQSEAARFGQANFSSTEKRLVSIGGLIIVSMVCCCTPLAVDNLLVIFYDKMNGMENVRCLVWTLVMTNSVINPVITYRFCPTVRQVVAKVFTRHINLSCTNSRRRQSVHGL